MSKAKGKGWPKLGTLRKGKNDKSFIVVDKSVDIFVNGEKLELGKYRTVRLMSPLTSIDSLFSAGHIDEAEVNKRKDYIEEKGIRYELVVPPEQAE